MYQKQWLKSKQKYSSEKNLKNKRMVLSDGIFWINKFKSILKIIIKDKNRVISNIQRINMIMIYDILIT